MNVRDQQIADELKNINVTKESFELWLQNDVTRMFRLQLEQEYLEVTQETIESKNSRTIEQIAIGEITRSANAIALQKTLDWSPDFGQDD